MFILPKKSGKPKKYPGGMAFESCSNEKATQKLPAATISRRKGPLFIDENATFG